MASYSAVRSVHKTLTGTTVDTITLTGTIKKVAVLNRAAAGAADLSITHGEAGTTPAAPTALVDDSEFVAPGGFVELNPLLSPGDSVVVKIIGNGNAYSVIGLR